jgi:NAD(P)-dependent dehydrogenase (short-subunit alcohol dehydrogenase family)
VDRTALVTGGNRGIGLEVCRALAARGLRVLLGARDEALGEEAALRLRAKGLAVRAVLLDVGRDASIAALGGRLAAAGEQVDVLVNNAGIYPSAPLLGPDGARALAEGLEVNLVGAVRTCRAFLPGMVARGHGRVVNVSSGYGSFGEGLEGPAAYSISKAALNALTVKLAEEVRGTPDVKVNAVCPGWVRTRMGGAGASRPVERGAETVVWLATLPPDGPSGRFFRDRREIPW